MNRSQLAVRHHALTELGRAAHDLVVRDFYVLGLVDVALRGDEVVAVRLSHLGRRLLGGEAPAPPEVRPLVVNPDFEVIVMPEGDLDDLLHELDRYAVRVRTGEVVHYRLDRTRIERAAVQDVPADEIVDLLTRHCRAEVPQNVAYTIRSWAGGVRSATLERGLLFTANDPSVVEAILRHPELRECVERVVDGTTVFFNHKVKRRRLAQELRALGVYVR